MNTRPWIKNYDYNVPQTIQYPRFPVQNLVHIAAATLPHKAATYFMGSEMTFRQIRSQVLRMANTLLRMGIQKGDRIGLAVPNCPQYVIAYYAALSTGAVVVNINPLYTYDELKFMMQNTGLNTLVTFDLALPIMRPLTKELGLQNVIVTKMTDYIQGIPVSSSKSLDLEEGWKHFSELIAGCPDAYRGETVKAYIVLKPGETATDKEIIAFCKEKLAPYKVPKAVEFRNALPKSAIGKVLRKILRDEEAAKSKK